VKNGMKLRSRRMVIKNDGKTAQPISTSEIMSKMDARALRVFARACPDEFKKAQMEAKIISQKQEASKKNGMKLRSGKIINLNL
jgi:hypothetical protein